jgi:hypothetical protein
MTYCDRAVDREFDTREAYNNRGVLRALTGEYAAGISDFERAGSSVRPLSVAARNLERAQVQLARQQEQNREIHVVEHSTP